jgi:hypothetical protein
MIGMKADFFDFFVRMKELQNLAANDNRFSYANVVAWNFVSPEVIRTFANFTRDEGVP